MTTEEMLNAFKGKRVLVIGDDFLTHADFVWTEPTRGILWIEDTRAILWIESTRSLVWNNPEPAMPATLIERLGESGPYAYDFANDAVIASGDTIASVTSVIAVAQSPIGASLPAIGGSSISGTKVIVAITGTQDGTSYLIRFSIVTTAGWHRVGLGVLAINES